ncbi:MAG: hypothetical protein ACP5D9_13570, partial [Mariniphaga sp.]
MTGRKKIQKIGRWLVLTVLILLFIAALTTSLVIPAHVKNYLSEFTKEKSEGIYTLNIDKMKFQIFPFSVKINRIILSPDEKLTLKQKNHHQKTYYTFAAAEIEIEGIQIKPLLQNRRFLCRKIRITSPAIKFEGENLLKTDSVKINSSLVADIRPLFEEIEEVHIQKIEMEEANFDFYGAPGNKNFISKAEKVSVDVLGFKTNSKMIKQNTGFFETDDVLIRMHDFTNDMGDSLH